MDRHVDPDGRSAAQCRFARSRGYFEHRNVRVQQGTAMSVSHGLGSVLTGDAGIHIIYIYIDIQSSIDQTVYWWGSYINITSLEIVEF